MSDHALRTLLRGISDVLPGSYVHADTLRPVFDPAGLTSAEKSGALRTACREGYLTAVTIILDGQVQAVTVRTQHEAGKGRFVRLYRRTDKAVAAHLCGVAA